MERISEYRPYLIQRCTIDNDPEAARLKSILDYDYMGSAEFEFGAIPASLARLRVSVINEREKGNDGLLIIEIPNKVAKFGPYAEKKMYALVQKTKHDSSQWLEDFFVGVEALITNNVRLKEWSGIDRNFTVDRFASSFYDVWHDIKNDVFFAFSYEVLALIAANLYRDISIANANEMQQWFKGGQTIAFVNPRKGTLAERNRQTAERWQLREGKIVSMDDKIVTVASKGDRFRIGWNMIITCPDESLGKLNEDLVKAAARR